MQEVPHGGMFQLHQILENQITENTASVLGLASRKWSARLVEVNCNQRGVTGVTGLLSNLWEEKKQNKAFCGYNHFFNVG